MRVIWTLTLFVLSLVIVMSSPVHAGEIVPTVTDRATVYSAQADRVMKNLVAAEAAAWAMYGEKYQSMTDLLELRMVDPDLVNDPEIQYTIQLEGQNRFNIWAFFWDTSVVPVVSESAPPPVAGYQLAWFANETGVIGQVWARPSMMLDSRVLRQHFTEKAGGCPYWETKTDAITEFYIGEIQGALRHWSLRQEQVGTFPTDINQLVQDRIIPGFYPNPVTGVDGSMRNATCVKLGKWSAGDFSYLPCINPETGYCEGYLLVAYSVNQWGGMDFDHGGVGDGILTIVGTGSYITSDPIRDVYRPTRWQW